MVRELRERWNERKTSMLRSAATWLLVTVVLGVVGCQNNADAIRASLSVRETGWRHQLDALESGHAALEARLPAGAGADPELQRVRATVGGMGQSLVDVEGQLRQIGPLLDKAIARGGDEGGKALEAETAKMDGYLESLAGDLTAAGHEIDGLGQGAASTKRGPVVAGEGSRK